MANAIRFTQTLKTRKANNIPGNTELVLTSSATDVNGNEYPRGTRLVPSASGYDNDRNSQYADAVILAAPIVYTIELSDVTPNRATVAAVHEGDVRVGSLRYATVSSDLCPEIGERVWVRAGNAQSRGPVEITGRGPNA